MMDEIAAREARGDQQPRSRIDEKIAEQADPRLFQSKTKPNVFKLEEHRDHFAQWRDNAWKAFIQSEGITWLEAPNDTLTDDDATRPQEKNCQRKE